MSNKKISQLDEYTGSPSGFTIPGVTSAGTRKANLANQISQALASDTTKANKAELTQLSSILGDLEYSVVGLGYDYAKIRISTTIGKSYKIYTDGWNIEDFSGGYDLVAVRKVNDDGTLSNVLYFTINQSALFFGKSHTFLAESENYEIWLRCKSGSTAKILLNEVGSFSERIGRVTKPCTISLVIPMVGGEFATYNGKAYGSVTSSSRIFNNHISEKYLSVDDLDEISFVSGFEEAESKYVFCYDNNFTLLSISTDRKLSNGTKYVRFMISSTSQMSSSCRKIVVEITSNSIVNHEFVAEQIFSSNGLPTLKLLSYPIQTPSNVHQSSNVYDGFSSELNYNNGYIILPANYNALGEKVPLIVFCHGTGGYAFDEYLPSSIVYYDYINALAKCGYAVCDCSSMSFKYKDYRDINIPNPLSILCYKELIECIGRRYNVDTEHIYVMGKSAGGAMAFVLSNQLVGRVSAIASLAGSLDNFTGFRYLGNNVQSDPTPAAMNLCLTLIGFNNPNVSSFLNGSGDKQYMKDNAISMVGYNALWCGTIGMNFNSYADKVLSHASITDYESDSELVSIINSSSNTCKIPVKIWHATNDIAVPIATSRFLQKMIRNAGGLCLIREFVPPQDSPWTDGHHAVDNDPNAPHTNYTTPFGEVIDMPTSYAEVLDWFKQW